MKSDGYCLPPLIQGRLIRRYKRFLADVRLSCGAIVTAHCPNSGSMTGCAIPGSRVWISESHNPRRKLKYTWELIQTADSMIGINTQVPNKLVKVAIEHGQIPELAQFTRVRPEVVTSPHTRLDLLLEDDNHNACYVEIKNCTLVEKGQALFPDAVTTRGQKHLDELVRLKQAGHRAVIFYLIQRTDARVFSPADRIDPAYGEKLRQAVEKGVEIITRDTLLNTREIRVNRSVPVSLAAN
jgi:sugar fermentation stimulation protein A